MKEYELLWGLFFLWVILKKDLDHDHDLTTQPPMTKTTTTKESTPKAKNKSRPKFRDEFHEFTMA